MRSNTKTPGTKQMTWQRQKETQGCKYTREGRKEVKTTWRETGNTSAENQSHDSRPRRLHLRQSTFCLCLLPHWITWEGSQVCRVLKPDRWSHAPPAAARSDVYPKCTNIEHAECPNHTKFNTALLSVLRNKPAKCEVHRMNGSPDLWITDRQTESLCLILKLDLPN